MCPFPSMAAQVNYELDYQRLGSHYGRPGPHNPAYAQVQVLILLIRHFYTYYFTLTNCIQLIMNSISCVCRLLRRGSLDMGAISLMNHLLRCSILVNEVSFYEFNCLYHGFLFFIVKYKYINCLHWHGEVFFRLRIHVGSFIAFGYNTI